ncbi:hypothetical protein RhiLY_11167 [Ceratobasidium sp. AG-Ba]|nr:hypothetical protein RhiLY_11167 [Ceratobasidium sp. AG-Ba]
MAAFHTVPITEQYYVTLFGVEYPESRPLQLCPPAHANGRVRPLPRTPLLEGRRRQRCHPAQVRRPWLPLPPGGALEHPRAMAGLARGDALSTTPAGGKLTRNLTPTSPRRPLDGATKSDGDLAPSDHWEAEPVENDGWGPAPPAIPEDYVPADPGSLGLR